MRITSGFYSGITIKTPKGLEVRPTLSKIRQAVFNMLRPRLNGAVFFDFFSGSGAFGIEAVSYTHLTLPTKRIV